MKYLVVARYKENIDWVNDVSKEFVPIVVQKRTDELEGDMPNAGREASSYFFAIAKKYKAIQPDDIWAFAQGHPFDHCPDLVSLLNQTVTGFTWLGDPCKYTDATGEPTHPNLPIAEKHKEWLGDEFEGRVDFAPGAQFMVTGGDILKHPHDFYLRLMDDFTEAYNAWVAERLWHCIFP